MAQPVRAAIHAHPGGSHHRHLQTEPAAAPSGPDHHGPEHQGCHFCRLDGVALPLPQVVVVPPLRDFEVEKIELSDAPGAAPARLIRPHVRAPPRRA